MGAASHRRSIRSALLCREREACTEGSCLGMHGCCWSRSYSRLHGESRRSIDEENTEGASDEVCEQVLAERSVAFPTRQRSQAYEQAGERLSGEGAVHQRLYH